MRNGIRPIIALLCAAYFFLLFTPHHCFAQDKAKYDSTYIRSVSDTVNQYILKHPSKFKPESNRFRAVPTFSITYNEEDNFGAMIGAIGLYRSGMDTVAPLSSVSLLAGASINKSFFGIIKGTNYSKKGKFLIDYRLRYFYNNLYFWGLGYNNGNNSANKSSYKEMSTDVNVSFLFRPNQTITTGPYIGFKYVNSSDFAKPELIEGNPLFMRSLLLGIKFTYNSKDNDVIPTRGSFITFEQTIYPALWGFKSFYKTFLIADYYLPVWKGSVFAFDLNANLNWGDSPWFMWAQLGGSTRMRGYYQGRYRDRNMISAQMEIRQKIYKNHGIAVWGGAGNIFHSFPEFNIKETLPTYGAGYRFEFMGFLLNIDVGFGKSGQYAIIAGINQTF